MSSDPTIASIRGNVLTIEGVGTCTITAKQAGNSSYNAAPDVPQTLAVSKAAQTITLNRASLPRIANETFDPESYSTSGLPVTYSIAGTGNFITASTTAGNYPITISQAGNSNYSAATDVVTSFDVLGNSPYALAGKVGDSLASYIGVNSLRVGSNGKIYVPSAKNQIIILNADGSLFKVFGAAGIRDGELSNPTDVALDGSGNIYVADRGNHRIQVFNSKGSFLRKFGNRGSASGQLSSPSGIALDGTGKVYVMDTGNSRVCVFDNAGTFLFSFGSSGTGTSQFGLDRGLDVDNAGNIYVADQTNNRVQIFDNVGNYLNSFGSAGTGNGQFNLVKYIKVQAGSIYVADDSNGRIQVFDSNYNYVKSISWPANAGGVCGIALDANGNVYASNYNQNAIIEFSSSGAVLKNYAPIPLTNTQILAPYGVTFDANANLYVGTSENKVKVYSKSGAFIRQFGATGTGNGQFSSPQSIAVDNAGNVYVADGINGNVQVFDNAGAYVSSIGTGTILSADDLTLAPNGKLYITDGSTGTVYIYQTNGTFISSFQYALLSTALWGIAVDGSGTVYVADGGNKKIQVFDASNNFVRSIGSAGTGQGQFTTLLDVKVDSNGRIYAVDGNGMVQVFDNAGNYLFGLDGSMPSIGNSRFNYPFSIAVNAAGSVLAVSDNGNNLVQYFGLPAINIKQATTSIVTGTSYDFGNVNMLSNSGAKTFTIESLGTAPLILSGASTITGVNSSDFVVNISATSLTVAPTATTSFTVTFTPSAAGARTALLTIISNDPNQKTYTINLTGTGTKINQTITFGPIADVTVGDPSFTLAASDSAGLVINYGSSSGKVALSGSIVTIVSAGRDTITANQPGNANYNAATAVKQSFCIKPAKPTITETGDNTAAPTLTSSAASGNQWFLNGTAITGATNTTLSVTGPGVYTVQTKVDDCVSAASNNFAIIVTGDIAISESVRLYPNPTKDFVFVSGIHEQVTESIVIDMVGRSSSIQLDRQANILAGDIRNLSSGVYILKITTGASINQIKFIKQ